MRLVYHLVKEKGMTLAGAKQRLTQNKDAALNNAEIVERLKRIRAAMVSMKKEMESRA